MPTYQYVCTECEAPLEVVQSFTDEALTECPECHGRLRKVFTAVGVVFKGSGFYRTDSRNGSGASSGEASGKPGKDSDGGSKDAKPADSAAASTGSGPAASKPAGTSSSSSGASSGSSTGSSSTSTSGSSSAA